MQPGAGRLQQDGGRPATSGRKRHNSLRPQPRSTMTTEYQERFLPPFCHATIVSTSTQKDPYHPLKATNTDVTTFKSFYVTHKWIKHPPKPPQQSAPPKGHRRCTSAPHNTAHFVANQMASKVEDYTSVYKNDFRAWKVNKRQPFKLSDSLKVHEGLVVTSAPSKGHGQKNYAQVDSKEVAKAREPQPFESVTSYRSDYVPHPLQPRTRREKPAQQNTGLSLQHQVPPKPKAAWDINQQLIDEASEFLKQFKTWSLETKFHGQGKAKESGPPADHDNFLSTTHADYTPHECPRTKPILPSMQNIEKSNEPLQATTTMKEDYKAWDIPKRLPIVQKGKLDWAKKTGFSVCTRKPAESCSQNPKPSSPQPKPDGTAACNPSCNACEKHQCPVENGTFSGFECVSNENEESRSYWTTSLDGGATWPDGEVCEEPSQTHHIISCMVSSRS